MDALGDAHALGGASALGASLRAVALDGLGEVGAAVRAARDALSLCRLHAVPTLSTWAPAVRVLARHADAEEAAAALAEAVCCPDPPFDVEALRGALLGLANLARRPERARDAARAALARPVGAVPAATARIELDAGFVLARVGDRDGAARAASRALLRLDDRLHRALVIEACRLAEQVGPGTAAQSRLARLGVQ